MSRASINSPLAWTALGLILMTLVGECYGQLKVGYYNGRCGKTNVEEIVFQVVKKHFIEDADTVADLIRLQFHDCWVRGCDASILLEGKNTEKTAPPNRSVDGYEIIDEAKEVIEKVCPGVVSCADIVIIAARAAMFLGGSKWYEVETGRKDGRVSSANDAIQLPGPKIPVPVALQAFANRGLNAEDFVVLLGCHTVGTAHCFHYRDRLYNFRNTGRSDPSMSPTLLFKLRKECPRTGASDSEAFLDQTPRSEFLVDNSFYKAILANKGILEIDQQMALHPLTSKIVQRLADGGDEFVRKIGPAMVKLGRMDVLTGNKGEIRKSCRAVNRPSPPGNMKSFDYVSGCNF